MSRPYIHEATILPFAKKKTRETELARLNRELHIALTRTTVCKEDEIVRRGEVRRIMNEIEQLEHNFREARDDC